MSDEKLKLELSKRSNKAERILESTDRTDRFLKSLEKKLKKIPVAGNKLSHIPVLISLVRDFSRKRYMEIPMGSIIAIVGGLIYVLSPVDMLVDVIPFIGYLDDVAVFGLLWNLVEDDIKEYQQWQQPEASAVVVPE